MLSLTSPPWPGAAWTSLQASPSVNGSSELDFELLVQQQKLLVRLQHAAADSPRANYSNILGSQFANQGLTQQLISGCNKKLQMPPSPVLNSSASFGLDNSMAKAIMNARSAAFARRSQSLVDRGAVPTAAAAAPTTVGLSDWGLPGGKLDWGIQGEELNKFRKSASVAFRNNRDAEEGEPHMSWVQSLVTDGGGLKLMIH